MTEVAPALVKYNVLATLTNPAASYSLCNSVTTLLILGTVIPSSVEFFTLRESAVVISVFTKVSVVACSSPHVVDFISPEISCSNSIVSAGSAVAVFPVGIEFIKLPVPE